MADVPGVICVSLGIMYMGLGGGVPEVQEWSRASTNLDIAFLLFLLCVCILPPIIVTFVHLDMGMYNT